MDLVGTRRKREQKAVISSALNDIYQHDLQLYNLPPTDEIHLQEFEDLALERLQLLRTLEQATQKGFKPFSRDWKESVHNDLVKQGLKRYVWMAKSTGTFNPTESDLQARRTDHISHFILRLAYCRSGELRKWFVARELEWFKLRFLQLAPKSVENFLTANNLTYKPITQEEKSRILQELHQSTAGVNLIDVTDFYKVPFAEVITLIRSRRVFLEKGFAYIPSFELITCITGIFRTKLNAALSYACRRLPLLDDERINILLTNLHKIYTGKSYTQKSDGVSTSLECLDSYSRQHFPLCMRHIHETFRATHHMKHQCRLQYGLFTKAIGLSFEDMVTFWREEFTKKVDGEKFEKQYLYGIKHMFGKVGNMISYSSYSCIKIIMNNVGPGDHNGCPFKHWDPTALKLKLVEHGLGNDEVSEIVETAAKGHYQIACSKYFEHTHSQPHKDVINHPNQYFEGSLALSKEGKNTKEGNKSQVSKKLKPNEDVSMDVDELS